MNANLESLKTQRNLFGELITQAEAEGVDSTFVAPSGKRIKTRPNGYPARPGTGPEGETCRSCAHYARVNTGCNIYRKCGVIMHRWTAGPGTDIKASSLACSFWEKPKEKKE